jgi:hypothetical protein
MGERYARGMLRTLLMGAAAGAVGTVALDITTYLDMAIRGRPASDVPARTAVRLASVVGADLEPSGQAISPEAEQQAHSRQSGVGALLGYTAGLGVGAAYGLIRPSLGQAPIALSGIALGAAAMAAGDLPPILAQATNPREWGTSGWVSDIVPHLAYGFFTALAYEAFTAGELSRRGSTDPAAYLAAVAGHAYRHLRA